MKKYILTGVLLVWGVSLAWSCNLCGCSSRFQRFNGMLLGNSSYVGLQQQLQWYSASPIPSNDPNLSHGEGRNFFSYSSAQIGVGWNQNWQVTATIPYAFLHLENDHENLKQQGFGDLSIQLATQLLNDTSGHWRMWVSAGLEAPTGLVPADRYGLPAGFGIGNGAWDGIADVAVLYDGSLLSSMLEAGARWHGTDHSDYRLGNQYYARIWLYYSRIWKGLEYTPQLGLSTDLANQDAWAGFDQRYTGGHQISLSAQLWINRFAWSLGLRYDAPVMQNWAQGLIKNQTQCSFQIQYQW